MPHISKSTAFPPTAAFEGHTHWGVRPAVFEETAARRRCLRAIAALDLSPPYAVHDIITSASLVIRRRIEVLEFRGPAGVTAILVDTGRAIGLGVARGLAEPLRKHAVAHELGHVLLRHPLHPATTACDIRPGAAPESHVSPAEAEAELFAALLLSGPKTELPLTHMVPHPRDEEDLPEDIRTRIERAFPPTLTRGRA